MAPVARVLSEYDGILEPLQTRDTVGGQIEELHDLLIKNGTPPLTLIGHSWGAWLAALTAARYPGIVEKLILVGSGPFEAGDAAGIMDTRMARLSPPNAALVRELLRRMESRDDQPGPEEMTRLGSLMERTDEYDPIFEEDPKPLPFDNHVYERVWPEAAALRQSGKLLERMEAIRCPVIVIHGDYDPHPHDGVTKPLERLLPDFRMILLPRCGHTPWRERQARNAFFHTLATLIRE